MPTKKFPLRNILLWWNRKYIFEIYVLIFSSLNTPLVSLFPFQKIIITYKYKSTPMHLLHFLKPTLWITLEPMINEVGNLKILKPIEVALQNTWPSRFWSTSHLTFWSWLFLNDKLNQWVIGYEKTREDSANADSIWGAIDIYCYICFKCQELTMRRRRRYYLNFFPSGLLLPIEKLYRWHILGIQNFFFK